MTTPPPGFSRRRPMKVGQVARVVGVPRETLRTWLRDEAFDHLRQGPQEGAQRRFTDFEVICIAVYGRIVECTRDHEVARVGMGLTAKTIMDEWREFGGAIYIAHETFTRDRVMFFRRDNDGAWTADICPMDERFPAAMDDHIRQTYEAGPSFLFINLGRILLNVSIALLEVEIDMVEGE